jgi:hypothetical protein
MFGLKRNRLELALMDEIFTRGWDELVRGSGPLHIRLILQPLVATIIAIRAGWRDAGERLPFWTVVWHPAKRRLLLRKGWKDVGKVFLVAIVMDVIYQIIVLHWVYPVQALIVATLLAFVPYLVMRDLTNLVVSLTRLRPPSDNKGVSRHGPETAVKTAPGRKT